MKNQISSVKASRRPALKRGKLNHIRVEPADNGYTVIAQHDPDTSGGEPMGYYGDRAELQDKTVHADADSVAEHIRTKLGGKAKGEGPGKQGTAKHEKGESKAFEKSEKAKGDKD